MEVFKSNDGYSDNIWVLHADTHIMDKVENGPPPIFILDDGINRVRPLTVTSWKSETREVYLRPIPTSPNDKLHPHADTRAWKLGPRLAFHLKIYD